MYGQLSFISENSNGSYKTIVDYTTETLVEHGLKGIKGIQEVDGLFIYPKDYFNPLEHINQLHITDNTRSIHYFAGTWVSWRDKLKKRFVLLLGPKIYRVLLKIINNL